MIWQDIVIMIACFSFALALIPSIIGKNKPEKNTCLFTIIGLAAIAVCFATLSLWLSFTSEIASITAWSVLLFQRR
jgi:biotin transporter BioY